MNSIISVIFASDQETKLDNLALHRTAASLPFAGRYRCIDFTLSNLVNSQITSIGIVTRSNYSSLMDHIRMGRDWDLNRKNGGITVGVTPGNKKEIYGDFKPTVLIPCGLEMGGGREFTLVLSCLRYQYTS